MSKEIIKSIEINIGDTTVKVSPKQAKELFQALADLLGEQTYKMTVTPNWGVAPQQWWTTPGITQYGHGTAKNPIAGKITVTCSDNTLTSSSLNGMTNLTAIQ